MPPVLGLRDLTVVRDGKPILDDVSWEVEADQRWVVLGPNGAGKTTLLQVVSANMHPSSGTATGGIPEVVDDGVTGRLVPIEQVDDGSGTPVDPDRFVADLATALTEVVGDPEAARRMGQAGRRRVEAEFSWTTIAERTRAIYDEVLGAGASATA
jgi:energy-coupling factor transporter ATP-binding protein EcfA2